MATADKAQLTEHFEKLGYRFDRLPAWAQDAILRLTRDADDWKRKALEAASVDGADSDTRVIDGATSHGPKYRGLPAGARLQFVLGEERGHELTIDAHVHEGALHVTGDDRIVVRPRASNAITIEVTPRPR